MKNTTDFEEKLAHDYPFMHRDNPNASERYREYGIEFGGRGWNDIVIGCCHEIADLYKSKGIEPGLAPQCIKEKFAAFYCSFKVNDEEMYRAVHKIVSKWELLSEYTCQQCGNAGYKRPTSWIRTLCGKCYTEFIEKRKERIAKIGSRDEGKVFTKDDVRENLIYEGTLGRNRIKIPEGYEEIDDFAICNMCPEIDIIIPSSLKNIGYGAFNGTFVDKYSVHENSSAYTSIEGVLYSKNGKKLIKFPSASTKFTGLPYIMPDGVQSISEEAFMDCYILRGVVLPESLISIGPAAFSGCSNIKDMELPSGIYKIWDTAFRKCSFKNITVGEKNTRYICEDGVLYNKDKTVLLKYPALNEREHFEIPDTVLVIGVAAFSNSDNLKTIKIPDSVEIISNGAFAGCTFDNLILPYSLRLIGYHVFEGCDSIRELVVPSGVTNIDEEAFFGCGAEVINMEAIKPV